MTQRLPQIGSWYKDHQRGAIFEVVAFDEKSRTIEMQLIDGEISEYDYETWRSQEFIEQIEEPEDWRNPYELSHEDYHATNDVIVPETWDNPLDFVESDVINGLIDEPFEEYFTDY